MADQETVRTEAEQDAPSEVLLQDWTPMSRCLDWRIGRMAWNVLGGQLFADGDVPTLAHDSGTHSKRCAALLFGWCKQQQAADALPERIVVVEYAIGTGLFLRYLLDAFAELCEEAGDDFYDRLTVYATDVSAPMLRAARDRGLFANHREKVTLAFADILNPASVRAIDAEADAEPVDVGGAVHAAFANYALDLMPIDIFRRVKDASSNGSAPGGVRWEAVLVRTWLREAGRLGHYTDLDVDGVQALVEQGDAAAAAALGPIYSLLQTELRTFPFDVQTHPDSERLGAYADHLEAALGEGHAAIAEGTVVYHSGGAIEAAERIAETLTDAGFALFRDVGLHTAELASVPRTYQQFGPTVAAAVNMVEFDLHFGGAARSGATVVVPTADGVRNQSVRMLMRGDGPADTFREQFDGAVDEQTDALVQQARAEQDAAKAVEHYRQLLHREPGNWGLMAEAARRVLTGGLDPRLAIVIAAKGLTINTEHGADLWNVYADALWAVGDRNAARQAYDYALAVNPRHFRSHFGRAWLDAEDGRFELAFAGIGRALAFDLDGAVRADCLRLLDVCLRGQRGDREAFLARMAEKAGR